MHSTQELTGRLAVNFQGEKGIDAGGLNEECYLTTNLKLMVHNQVQNEEKHVNNFLSWTQKTFISISFIEELCTFVVITSFQYDTHTHIYLCLYLYILMWGFHSKQSLEVIILTYYMSYYLFFYLLNVFSRIDSAFHFLAKKK